MKQYRTMCNGIEHRKILVNEFARGGPRVDHFGTHEQTGVVRPNVEMNGDMQKGLAKNGAFTTVVSRRGMPFSLAGNFLQ